MTRYEEHRQFDPKFDHVIARFIAWFRYLEIIGSHFIVHGVVLLTQEYATATYEVIFNLAPQRVWGVVFIVIGLLMWLSRWNRNVLTPVSYALMFMVCSMWSLASAWSHLTSDLTSPTSPVLWGLLTFSSIYGAVMAEGEDED